MEAAGTLPAAVQALALRSGAGAAGPARQVRFTQEGRMRSGPSGRWMRFRAEQRMALDACAFDWTARVGPFGLVRVTDALEDGRGRLAVTMAGLPLMRAPASPALDRGEVMRYLAELVWAPEAMLSNRHLRWQVAADGAEITVSAREDAAVTFTLGGDGRVASIFAPDRPMFTEGAYRPTPWFGRLAAYRAFSGYWLPCRAEVGWEIGGAQVVCWEGSLTAWAMA